MPFKTYNYDIKTQRLSWEKYALELAKTASLRSEDPYVQVGACALDSQHKVLGLGYNGLAPGKEVEKELSFCGNCLINIKKGLILHSLSRKGYLNRSFKD